MRQTRMLALGASVLALSQRMHDGWGRRVTNVRDERRPADERTGQRNARGPETNRQGRL